MTDTQNSSLASKPSLTKKLAGWVSWVLSLRFDAIPSQHHLNGMFDKIIAELNRLALAVSALEGAYNSLDKANIAYEVLESSSQTVNAELQPTLDIPIPLNAIILSDMPIERDFIRSKAVVRNFEIIPSSGSVILRANIENLP